MPRALGGAPGAPVLLVAPLGSGAPLAPACRQAGSLGRSLLANVGACAA